MWHARDDIAAQQDVSPGRVLSDATIVEVARGMPVGRSALRVLPGMRHRQGRRHLDAWVAAMERASRQPDSELPLVAARSEGPPPPRSWPDRNPPAAARLAGCRAVVAALSEQHTVPAENLVPPEAVRRLAWEPPPRTDPETVRAALLQAGARAWQADLVAAQLAAALTATPG
jgi:ribonuclease D